MSLKKSHIKEEDSLLTDSEKLQVVLQETKMKWTLLTPVLTALITLAYAFDGNSICEVQGFKISFSKVSECCLKNTGGSNFENNTLYCTLPVSKEGPFRKCVKDLGYATSVECNY
jgi:hypothetical protein